ncbi:MAG: hypothetical protein GXX82_16535 [Syntrophorhabdus sp.]|nr:hypothetical protein [Syntrophorhabdus sp.]
MAQYRLKPNEPDIEIVDGPFARKKFVAGRVYTEIPPKEAARFEAVDQYTPPTREDEEYFGGEE